MKYFFSLVSLLVLALAVTAVPVAGEEGSEWSMNATVIEACSCPMFCPCYFNTEPASHVGHGDGEEAHFCKFNMGFKVNEGHHGDTKLAGTKFWISGDLGSGWEDGTMDWAILTFDSQATPAQREAITTVLPHLFPVEWNSFQVAEDGKIDWKASKERSVARLNDGKTAEVVLVRKQGTAGNPPVIKGLTYWGAPRNDGFVLMPNEVQAYRVGDQAFETQGTNGFMITVDIKSSDVKE